MEGKSQQKVMAAGFIILRADDQPTVRIKFKSSEQLHWKTFGEYVSKAARDRAMEGFMEEAFYIQD